jgi:hypothetical protein
VRDKALVRWVWSGVSVSVSESGDLVKWWGLEVKSMAFSTR